MDNPDLADAARLLADAHRAEPGWSAPYGGPEGVALEAERLRAATTHLLTELIDLRSAAYAELLEEESLRAVEKRTGLSRSTISKAHRAWLMVGHFRDLKETW